MRLIDQLAEAITDWLMNLITEMFGMKR